MTKLVVLGGGGHAKVVIATAAAVGWQIGAVLDDDSERHGMSLLGHVVAGPIADALADARATCVLAIGSNATRRKLAARALCKFATIVHPSACVHATVKLGPGTVVFAGAIIQPDTRVGAHGIVNTSASIDHDCALGDAVHIAPGVRLAGGISIGDETFIGIGAAVIPSIHIGSRAVVGAGAVVVRDVADGSVVTGVPARVR